MFFIHPDIVLKKTKDKGLGVFAFNDINPSILIEIAPVIVLDENDTKLIHQTKLHDYYFSWGENQQKSAIALGYISIYNHAEQPNCKQEFNFEEKTISIHTNQKILAGEELCIHYLMFEDKQLWFEVK